VGIVGKIIANPRDAMTNLIFNMISSSSCFFEHAMDGFYSEEMHPLLSVSEQIVDLLA
jgi:hypothetical protein